MIRTITQRLYLFGLLPLALLAVALVVLNGLARLEDTHRQLQNERDMTAALLRAPALDALVVGNVLGFEDAVRAVIHTSRSLRCVTLTDARGHRVASVGNCEGGQAHLHYVRIFEPREGLSDFNESVNANPEVLGELGVWVHDESFVRKREQVLLQLALSVLMITVVITWVGSLLRRRLVEPIQHIGSAMEALSKRDYSVRVETKWDDELSRLARAVNDTIATIAKYTRELERRRAEADQALHDADAAYLARDGLVRSLTQDLAEPMQRMYSELTEIAVANTDPDLKGRIRDVMGMLQTAQNDFSDLMEIATSSVGARAAPWFDLADLWADMQRDVRKLSETEQIPVNFVITKMQASEAAESLPPGILLNLDGVRLKKVLRYLVHAMARRSREPGVQVNAELIRLSDRQLHLSLHLTAFYDAALSATVPSWAKRATEHNDALQTIVGTTDRESKIVQYLLRAIGLTPAISESPAGAVNVLLTMTCRYTIEQAGQLAATDWRSTSQAISATIISDDAALVRFTTRGEMSNVELSLVSFAQALQAPAMLREQDAVLLDIADDIAQALNLIEQARAEGVRFPRLIAICPPGRISDALGNRLFELGFSGIVQRPLQYSRLVEVVRSSLAHPLSVIQAGHNRE